MRELSFDEIDVVSGGEDKSSGLLGMGWTTVFSSGSGGNSGSQVYVYQPGDEPLVTVTGYRIDNSALLAISLSGSLIAGTYYGLEAAEAVSTLIEAGIIGAEYGAAAGPVGVVIGIAVGAATGVALHQYGPQIRDYLSNINLN